jgi:hypothetical protein
MAVMMNAHELRTAVQRGDAQAVSQAATAL